AARQADLFADLVRGVVIEFGELPVVEDTEIVELLLDRARHARELLEIVGGAARTGEALEARGLRRRRQFFAGRLHRRPDVDPDFALRTRDTVDRSARHQIAIERNGAAGVVI